jgi:hypothetical protein
LRRQVGGRRLRLTDDDRRKLAARAYRLGRQALRAIATIVTPDTLLRWHRQLIARKMHVRQAGKDASRSARGNPPIDPADGGGESWVGLHAHPRCPQEPRAPRRPVNDCTDPASTSRQRATFSPFRALKRRRDWRDDPSRIRVCETPVIVGRIARRLWSSAAAIRPSPPRAWRLLPGSAARREQRHSGPTVARQHHAARRRSVVCLASWERPACFINTRGATRKVTGGSGWQRSAGNLEIPVPNLTPKQSDKGESVGR